MWELCYSSINGKVTFAEFMSGIRPPDCSKLTQNPKNDNDVTIFRPDVIVKFFVSLFKFSYWSKFHVNIITGSGIMTILFSKALTRNPEIGIPRLGFGQDLETVARYGYQIWHKWLQLNITECCNMPGVTALTVFELWRENQQGVG